MFMKSETHGGEGKLLDFLDQLLTRSLNLFIIQDVAIYSSGPMSHLFDGFVYL